MELEVFDGWTIDRRLQQLRKIDENDKILFVDFDDDLGQAIFEKKILISEFEEMVKDNCEKDEASQLAFDYDLSVLKDELKLLDNVINKLEGQLK